MAEIGREPEEPAEYVEPYWFVEVWQELRPSAIKLFADFSIFAVSWILLVAAHVLTVWLPLETRLSRVVTAWHEVVIVTIYLWLSLAAAWDIMYINRKGVRHGAQSQRSRS